VAQFPAITGAAELVIQRLELSDLAEVKSEGSYLVNLGLFVRTSVVVHDKPRTISGFLLELCAGEAQYSAQAEREIGNYCHRYSRAISDEWGYVREFRDEMASLWAIVRTTPIAPDTQAEGWLRFEFKGVRGGHEPKNGRMLRLYAFDVNKNPYRLDTEV
jgi:hypothetical protein